MTKPPNAHATSTNGQSAWVAYLTSERMGMKRDLCEIERTRNGKEHDLPLVRQGRRGCCPFLMMKNSGIRCEVSPEVAPLLVCH
jgi:hypothetical protein